MTKGPKPKPLAGKFHDKYIPEPNSGCWIWTAALDGRGYGKIKHAGKFLQAHRVSWEFKNGKILNGLFVCHKCDVRCCVNPSHMFLGTCQDNLTDMVNKGRSCRKTHCKNGHILNETTAKIRFYKGVGRFTRCIICGRKNRREWKKRRKNMLALTLACQEVSSA